MSQKISSVVAKKEDGEIQITFAIPNELVAKTKSEVLSELAKDTEIPGFRKGMAPTAKVEERIDKSKLIEHILSHLLPGAFSDSISQHKFSPALYPKYEAVKMEDGKDWEIRAITCELPEVKLGNYKKQISSDLSGHKIIVPGKEPTKISDEQVINLLLKAVEITIPRLLITEEVNSRLSQLLQRIEKLGLTLEGYLASIKETSESLRKKYESDAQGAIALELILNKIADEERIEVSKTDLEEFIKSTGVEIDKVDENQKTMLKRVLLRHRALEKVASL